MKITEEERREIIKLRKKGKKQKEIAFLLGRSLKPIKRVLKEEGIGSALKRTVTCLNCEEDYLTEREHTKFCSDSCRVSYNKTHNGTSELKCLQCGSLFQTYYEERKYCSDSCYKANLESRPKAEPEPYIPVKKVKKICVWCGSSFRTTIGVSRSLCSPECIYAKKSAEITKRRREENLSKERECLNCGEFFRSEKNQRMCSKECSDKYKNRLKEYKRRKRVLENGRVDKSITLERLIKRDENVCYLCGSECDKEDYKLNEEGYFITGFNYPSVEHVIPISKGGTHTWDNVKLAHYYCNILKSNKVQ